MDKSVCIITMKHLTAIIRISIEMLQSEMIVTKRLAVAGHTPVNALH